MKETISKNLFLSTVACPTLGWRLRAGEVQNESLTLGQRLRMEQGAEIGHRARKLFPDGVFVATHDLDKAIGETACLIRAGGPSVLFEAAFGVDAYVAKADILKRTGDTWHLIEVKSNANLKPGLTDDLAYTLMIVSQAGLKISKASLLLISKDFRLGMEDSKLFIEYDCTADAQARVAQFRPYWEIVSKQTSAATMPDPSLIAHCKDCKIFSDCLGKSIENHIFEIPRLSPKKLEALKNLGVCRIEAIPCDFDLTPTQNRIRQAVVTGRPWLGPDLKTRLSEIRWPAHYLDFETMMTALPLYPELAPYTQVVTQYSIHSCTAMGKVQSHKEYLSDPRRDGRRDLAQALIVDLKGEGSIVTYSNFEKNIVNALRSLFPDLATELDAINQRMFDLEAVIRENYYHPAFHGSTSVKATLPAVLPDMSYNALNIGDGDSASATFAYMAMGRYGAHQIESLKKDLLAYCGQDTLAMVKLHERLYDEVNKGEYVSI